MKSAYKDDLEATRMIMSKNPTPIVVISSTVDDESLNTAFYILEAGALTVLAKPLDILLPSFTETRKQIIDTLRGMAKIQVIKKTFKKTISHEPYMHISQSSHYELIAIGTSLGGPRVLKIILSQLAVDFPLPIVVVQQMGSGLIHGFTQWLAENVMLNVKNPYQYEVLQKGTVYIAPEKCHLEIVPIDGKLACQLTPCEADSVVCPSITKLFKSIASVVRKNAIGILLTGVGDDGAEGLLDLKKVHGHTLIQDPYSALVFDTAAVAQSLGAVDKVIELDRMAHYLTKICP